MFYEEWIYWEAEDDIEEGEIEYGFLQYIACTPAEVRGLAERHRPEVEIISIEQAFMGERWDDEAWSCDWERDINE